MTRPCGAKARSGTRCRRPAGWGTSHPRTGRCKLHGGATPNGEKAAAKEQALQFAAASLGDAAPIDPLEAQLLAVHLSNGMVQFWRSKLAAEPRPSQATVDGYRAAIGDLSRYSKTATDSRVYERQWEITERLGDAFVAVCEEGHSALIAAGVIISNDARVAYAEAIARGLEAREQNPGRGVIEGNGRALAA